MACQDCTELMQGEAGYNGWYFLLADVVDSVNLDANGDSRVVQQITGYAGGTGPTPTTYNNYYLGASGPVAAIASATNVRGDQGTSYDLTSTTNLNLPIADGSQALTVSLSHLQSAYKVGARIRVSDSTTPTTNYFEGVITAYSGTTLTLLIDFSTDVVDTNIATWNINIAGEPAAGLGFDDVAWETFVPTTTGTTTGSPGTPAAHVVTNSATGVFDITALTGSPKVRYKIMGKTCHLNFYIAGNVTIENGAVDVGVIFYIQLPTGVVAKTGVVDSGSAFIVPVATGFTNAVHSNTMETSSVANYLTTQNFALDNAGGGGTSGAFLLNGAITFELE